MRHPALPAAAAHGSRARVGTRRPALERAIGVLYLPETERASHYFHARLPEQFDYVLHFDETRAVEPLERNAVVGSWRSRRDVPVRIVGPVRRPRCHTSAERADACRLAVVDNPTG